MKKRTIIFATFGFLSLLISGCTTNNDSSSHTDPVHEHTFSTEWSSDETYHWHDSTCGHDVVSDKTIHAFDDVITPATYEHGGYTTHTCSICGYFYKDNETAQLPHHYSSTWSHDETTHWHACIDEGYEHLKEDESSHSFDDVVTPATYEHGGYTTHTCDICGFSYIDSETSKLDHNYSIEWSHDENTHWHACIDSGYENLKGDESHHTFNDIVTPPTYESGGYTTHTCSVCGYSFVDSETDPLAHNYSPAWSYDASNHWHACIDTGYENLKTDVEAHTFNEVVIPATYEHGGYTIHTCSLCSYSYNDNETDPLVHNYSTDWSHDENSHWHYCIDEGYEDLYEDYDNHQMISSIVPATNDAEGYTLHSCEECGYSYKDNYTSAPDLFVYQLNSDETGYGIYGYTGLATVLSIPQSHNGLPVLSIGYKGFMNNTSIEVVIIPNSVNSIGVYAFSGCTSLKSISLSNQITEIRDNTFQNCSSLTELVIPNSVAAISSGALSGCSSLESLTLPFVGGSISASTPSESTLFGYVFGTASYDGAVPTKQYYSTSNYVYYYIPASLKSVSINGGDILFGGLSYLDIQSLNLGFGVTHIGQRGIYYCGSLKSVDMSQSNIVDFGSSAFAECSLLSNVVLPSTLTSIVQYCFRGCSSLASITIPDTVDVIGNYAFQECSSLASIVLPNAVSSIGNYSFSECSLLQTVTAGSSLVSIGNYAFNQCALLSSISINSNLESIGSYAFCGCLSLASLTIPASVNSIGTEAFSNCPVLQTITVDINNENYSDENGVLYNKNKTTLIRVPSAFSGDFVIPNTVTSISSGAFDGCSSITSIVIPNTVSSIAKGALSDCSSLKEIVLPYVGGSASSNQYLGYIFGASSYSANSNYVPTSLRKVTVDGCSSIAANAFYGCSKLTSITISNTVTSIGSAALSGCSSLESVTLPFVGSSATATSASSTTLFGYIFGTTQYSGSTSITQYYSSSSSKTYYIPTSLTKVTVNGGRILYGAFSYLKIQELKLGSGIISIGLRMAYYCQSLVRIDMSEVTVTDLPKDSFSEDSLLSDVVLSPYLKTIGDYAFNRCVSLTSIDLPDSVVSIGTKTFQCAELTSITLPDSVTELNSYAFNECASLETVYCGLGLQSIGACAFRMCSSLSAITFGNNLNYIGNYAFHGCTSLTSVELPDSLASLGEYTFYECYNLTSVSFGNGLETIINGMFSGCTRLTTVNISTSVTSIGNNAFENCTSLEVVFIPSSVNHIGEYAFKGCSSLTRVYCFGSPADLTIDANNSQLLGVIYYYSANEPTDASVNYWHYVNGVPTLW